MSTSAAFEALKARREEVIKALEVAVTIASDVGTPTLRSRIEEQLIDKLRENRFHLVVVGEFNHGKSSLVNALLGDSVLAVGVTPTTATIHRVRYGETSSASVVGADGQVASHPFESLNALSVKGEADKEEVQHVDVCFPSNLLREGITLIDTPGVNDLCLQRADVTYEYIPQSDAVVFVLDAGQPLKESERLFLKEKLLAKSRDKIVFVVCKADIWTDSERGEAMSYIREELSKLVDEPVVFAVSTTTSSKEPSEPMGVAQLKEHLTTYLAEERGRIVVDNALGEAEVVCATLSRAVDARRRVSVMTQEELVRRIETIDSDLLGHRQTLEERRSMIRSEVAAIKAWVARDRQRFCDDVFRQLSDAAANASADELRRHWVGFVQATFTQWATAEAAEVAEALERLADQTIALMREDARDAAQRLSEDARGDLPPPNVVVDSFAYDLSVAALFGVGMGMVFSNVLVGVVMTSAAPALAYYLKGRIEEQTRDKAEQQATSALTQAVAAMAPRLDEMIDRFASALDAWVVEAGREIHAELLDVLRASQQEREHGQIDIAQTAEQCDELAERINKASERFEAIRRELWST